jgi:hypothetical protein
VLYVRGTLWKGKSSTLVGFKLGKTAVGWFVRRGSKVLRGRPMGTKGVIGQERCHS